MLYFTVCKQFLTKNNASIVNFFLLKNIKRICNEFNFETPMKSLYCIFVRSILEYGSVMWDHDISCDLNQIRSFQRICLNYVAYKLEIDHPLHDYSLVLRRLGLNTLANRRFEANLVFLRRLIDNTIDSPKLLKHINFKVSTYHARHVYLFSLPICVIIY